MAAKKLKTEVRKRQIAEAALEAVAAGGVRNLSVAGIARRAGMAPSNLYRHYRGKSEVIRALLEFIDERLRSNLAAASASARTPMGRLRDVLLMHLDLAGEFRSIPILLFSEEIFHGDRPTRRRLQSILGNYFRALAAIAAEAREAGEIRPDIPPDRVALMAFGTVMPAGILWHLTGGGFDLRAQARSHWELLEEALSPAGGRRRRKARDRAKQGAKET